MKTYKPKFFARLPSYFFILVKVIGIWQSIALEQVQIFPLILLANRFNTPYYLWLNTGEWSGGETSGG